MSCTHSIIIAYETQEIHHGVTEGTAVDGNALRAEHLLRGPNEPVKFAAGAAGVAVPIVPAMVPAVSGGAWPAAGVP